MWTQINVIFTKNQKSFLYTVYILVVPRRRLQIKKKTFLYS